MQAWPSWVAMAAATRRPTPAEMIAKRVSKGIADCTVAAAAIWSRSMAETRRVPRRPQGKIRVVVTLTQERRVRTCHAAPISSAALVKQVEVALRLAINYCQTDRARIAESYTVAPDAHAATRAQVIAIVLSESMRRSHGSTLHAHPPAHADAHAQLTDTARAVS